MSTRSRIMLAARVPRIERRKPCRFERHMRRLEFRASRGRTCLVWLLSWFKAWCPNSSKEAVRCGLLFSPL
jgi:hypothetical protein